MRIRVLHFLESLPRAGTGLQLLRYLRHSDPKRLEHHVLAVLPSTMTGEFRVAGIPVSILGIGWKFHPGIVFGLRRHLRRLRPHILHSYLAQPNLLCATLGHLLGAPRVVLEERGIELWKPVWWQWAERCCYARADRVLANAQAVAERVRRRSRIAAEKVQVLPTGVDLEAIQAGASQRDDLRRQLGIAAGGMCIGTVTRLFRLKGNHVLLAGLAPLLQEREDACCLIVGGGPEREHLEQQAVQLGIAGRVRFLGVRNDVPALLAAMDIFIHSSTEEGLPSAVLEAMAAGKPIIATDAGGTRELIQNDRTGLLIPVNDEQALSASLRRLLEDAGLRRHLAWGALQEVERYDWQRLARARDEFYEAACLALPAADSRPEPAQIAGTERPKR